MIGYRFSSILHQFLHILHPNLLLQLLQNPVTRLEPLNHPHLNLSEFNGLDELLEIEELGVGLGEESSLVGSFFEGEEG